MFVTAVSDLHGYQPVLPGGSLLIIAGDLTANDDPEQYEEFREWLWSLDYDKTVIVPGNHDVFLESNPDYDFGPKVEVLIDRSIEWMGRVIYGTPWSSTFHGQNPDCCAFAAPQHELRYKFDNVPDDVDIFVSHSPAYGFLDETKSCPRTGSIDLLKAIFKSNARYSVAGHIHEGYGMTTFNETTFINASHVNRDYKPVNSPITLSI